MERNHDYWIYLSCKDSLAYNPQNKSNKFTVRLPEVLRFSEKWEVALTDLTYLSDFTVQKKPTFLVIHSNICDDSIINGEKISILQKIFIGEKTGKLEHGDISNLKYIRVKVNEISSIEIDIKTEEGDYCPFKENTFWCTLYFRKLQ